MDILGLSFFYHDAAACLLREGEVVAAAAEERFSRKKHDFGFPRLAAEYCLREAGIGIQDVSHVGFYEKPIVKFDRILSSLLATAPRSYRAFLTAMPIWLREKLWIRELIRRELGYQGEVLFGDHHHSHAASAFYASPFEEAAMLTLDGVGEWACGGYGYGRGTELRLLRELRFPHSLGMLYSVFTAFLGFEVNEGEYKVMGLAPYGRPRYLPQVNQVAHLHEDGSLWLNMRYFEFHRGVRSFGPRFRRMAGRRGAGTAILTVASWRCSSCRTLPRAALCCTWLRGSGFTARHQREHRHDDASAGAGPDSRAEVPDTSGVSEVGPGMD